MVYLDKLRLHTRAKEAEASLARGGKDPFIVVRNPSASKGGVAETSIKVRGQGRACLQSERLMYQLEHFIISLLLPISCTIGVASYGMKEVQDVAKRRSLQKLAFLTHYLQE